MVIVLSTSVVDIVNLIHFIFHNVTTRNKFNARIYSRHAMCWSAVWHGTPAWCHQPVAACCSSSCTSCSRATLLVHLSEMQRNDSGCGAKMLQSVATNMHIFWCCCTWRCTSCRNDLGALADLSDACKDNRQFCDAAYIQFVAMYCKTRGHGPVKSDNLN